MSKNSKKPEVASSPERHTFQDKNPDYSDLWEAIRKEEAEKIHNPEWQKDNLEYDLRSTEWVVEKARGDDVYAQNIYAALCNNEFTKLAVIPILTDRRWSCSWRHAGGIVADMLGKGDYIDWYCSGIRSDTGYDPDTEISHSNGYVPESVVTDEIRQDLQKLGWFVVENDDSID